MRHLEALVADAELVFQQLGLPYQVTILCTGDLGFAMAKTYDINCWAAGSHEWLECSSCSNANDYQARRANIRFRREVGGRTEYPHTLNGSGVGAAAHADRGAREQSAGRRLGDRPGGLATLPGRVGTYQSTVSHLLR